MTPTVRLPKPAKRAVIQHYCAQPKRPPRTFAQGFNPQRARALIGSEKKWVNGTVISYYCYRAGDNVPLDWQGSADDIAAVDDAFAQWFRLGIGITFKPAQSAPEAIVRIGFEVAGGSWSNVGREVLTVKDPRHRTMNFGWPLTDAYGRDTALHEVGHTLGLEHEHQSPFAGIVWDEGKVLDYFKKKPNEWDEATTRFNILDHMPADAVKGTIWDPDSIMEYAFTAGLIRQPAAYQQGLTPRGGLSARDKTWLRASYPALEAMLPRLNLAQSQTLALENGETRLFTFAPVATRNYRLATFGESDTVLVVFESTLDGNVQIGEDDDSGEERNAQLSVRLVAGRTYQIGLRLQHAQLPLETAVMVW